MLHEAIIISDTHLGSDICQAKLLGSFLQSILDGVLKTKKLIINGDLFDSFDFRRMKKTHWKVLSKIRHLSDKIEIIFIEGNHDGPADILSHLLGLQTVKEYSIKSGLKDIIIFHGDIFDNFINYHPIITYVGDFGYYLLQKIDKNHHIARYAKRKSKTFLRCIEEIKQKSIQYAKDNNYNSVVNGHTHSGSIIEENGITYANCGSWTENPPSYVSILNGVISLNYFSEQAQ